MKKKLVKIILRISVFAAFIGSPLGLLSQQQADTTFDAKVANPAYTSTHPKVLFDEAHNNFHTAAGRYKPFVDLITNDGYQVSSNKEKFQPNVLQSHDVLVIANALGASDLNSAASAAPAFTDDECNIVREWVRNGGALLLVADHAPAGGAAANLGAAFGVDMSKAFTGDPTNFQQKGLDVSWIVFSRSNGALGRHAIMEGRNQTERVNLVMSFTGQSLKGPTGAIALLKLSDAAYDVLNINTPQATTVPAGGRAQAVVMPFGKGRVAVFGEAAMLTAQNVNFGMNYPGLDNRQLVLNLMHWLTGLIK
jgi:hypothetical protein